MRSFFATLGSLLAPSSCSASAILSGRPNYFHSPPSLVKLSLSLSTHDRAFEVAFYRIRHIVNFHTSDNLSVMSHSPTNGADQACMHDLFPEQYHRRSRPASEQSLLPVMPLGRGDGPFATYGSEPFATYGSVALPASNNSSIGENGAVASVQLTQDAGARMTKSLTPQS